MVIRPAAAVLIISLCCAADVRAQAPAGSEGWSAIEALPAGTSLLIDLSSGPPLRGTLAASGADALTVMLSTGEQRALAKSTIDRIRSGEARKDGVGNGIAYGALAGAGTIAGFFVWAYKTCGGCDAPAVHEIVPPAMAMGAGIGAVTGFLIDRAIRHRAVLYRRGASPGGTAGLSVRLGGSVRPRAAAVQVAITR